MRSIQWNLYNSDDLEVEDVLRKSQHDDSLGKGGTHFLNSEECPCDCECRSVLSCKGALMILLGTEICMKQLW
ncbi:unnamed protein product [Tenebrio molitor]|nr:unnamed protein product [Tenebrio molitor]